MSYVLVLYSNHTNFDRLYMVFITMAEWQYMYVYQSHELLPTQAMSGGRLAALYADYNYAHQPIKKY